MTKLPLPSTVVREFLTWALWFVAFLVLQKSLCRRYPGLRTLCRILFLATALIAILPGFCTLLMSQLHGPRLLAAVNHVFGLSVFAQITVRSLLMVRWLTLSGSKHELTAAATGDAGLAAEPYVLASLLTLTHVIRLARHKPKPPEKALTTVSNSDS